MTLTEVAIKRPPLIIVIFSALAILGILGKTVTQGGRFGRLKVSSKLP